ncbi:MAG: pyruvate dehydrogenase (acetyl-transferring) E1 component subunit alpha, partial [Cellulomonadaceae bacterium]|nr:pyruvate dehydrogenase (acetyl-transferring) E1 component subunit alpha [Cellulomonadaceae bacterium]
TSDDPSRYRSSAEEEEWRRKDPIDRLRQHLEAIGELPASFVEALDAEGEALGVHLRAEVRAMVAPSTHAMFEHVYGGPHSVVDAERTWFEQYEASFADSGEGAR